MQGGLGDVDHLHIDTHIIRIFKIHSRQGQSVVVGIWHPLRKRIAEGRCAIRLLSEMSGRPKGELDLVLKYVQVAN